MKKVLKNKKAFTLTEMIVVIAIIGILAGVLIPTITGYIKRANQSAAYQEAEAVLNIYDELYKYRDKITHILTAHEQGASHAADGYARATGKVGVCLATSGPGATNLVTGIATAYMDSIPMVAITGNVTMPLLGKDSFQEVDIAGITMPITKHNYIVKDVNDLQRIINEAFYIAKEGRPGPVLIDIPKDITAAKAVYKPLASKEVERKTKHITDEALDRMIDIIDYYRSFADFANARTARKCWKD